MRDTIFIKIDLQPHSASIQKIAQIHFKNRIFIICYSIIFSRSRIKFYFFKKNSMRIYGLHMWTRVRIYSLHMWTTVYIYIYTKNKFCCFNYNTMLTELSTKQ